MWRLLAVLFGLWSLTAQAGEIRDWTVLVYMAADNSLEPYAFWDLHEMEAARPASSRSNLIVQLDTRGNNGLHRLEMVAGPEALNPALSLKDFEKHTLRDIRSTVVEVLSETNEETEEKRFQDFLTWGMNRWPARHTMVVVWGHGQGWTASETFRDRGFGGLAFSDSRGTFLSTPALKRALRYASDTALEGRPIDVYASDACLMQMAEVATEISDSTRFIAGSSQVQSSIGLPWRRLMQELESGSFAGEKKLTQSEDEPWLMARMLPKIMKNSLRGAARSGRASIESVDTVMMSALSSSELREVFLPTLKELGLAVQAWLAADPFRGIDLQAAIQTAPAYPGGAVELGSFLRVLKIFMAGSPDDSRESERLLEKIHLALDGIDRSVVAYAVGDRYSGKEQELALLGFRSLSVWLPVSAEDFRNRVEDFRSSDFYRMTGWDGWLRTLFMTPLPAQSPADS